MVGVPLHKDNTVIVLVETDEDTCRVYIESGRYILLHDALWLTVYAQAEVTIAED